MVFATLPDIALMVICLSIGTFLGWKMKVLHMKWKYRTWFNSPKVNGPVN